jgi:hypothetical protein
MGWSQGPPQPGPAGGSVLLHALAAWEHGPSRLACVLQEGASDRAVSVIQAVSGELALGRLDLSQAAAILASLVPSEELLQVALGLQSTAGLGVQQQQQQQPRAEMYGMATERCPASLCS